MILALILSCIGCFVFVSGLVYAVSKEEKRAAFICVASFGLFGTLAALAWFLLLGIPA